MNARIADLREEIRRIEQCHAGKGSPLNPDAGRALLETGWPAVDAALGGGLASGLHEWLGVAPALVGESDVDRRQATRPDRWTPPISILAHLAYQVLQGRSFADWAIWIGRCCHPYGRSLVRARVQDRRLLRQSLFVEASDPQPRVWAVDLALRSPAVGVVLADGSGWAMGDTQRVHLLAQRESKLALLIRPAQERRRLSAAQTRWLVRLHPNVPDRSRPRWSVELLRCKGVRPVGEHRAWLLEWNRGQGTVDLSAPLADRADPSAVPQAPPAASLASRSA